MLVWKCSRFLLLVCCVVNGGVSRGQAPVNQPLVPVFILFNQPPRQAQAELVASRGGLVTRQFEIVPAFAALLPAQAMAAMRAAPGVAAVELDIEVTAHDYNNVWGVRRVGAPSAHSGSWAGTAPWPVTGTNVSVAILDSGVDYDHPDLKANYRGGFDYVNNDLDPRDDNGHGSHVSGTVAAVKDDQGVVGVAPQVDLYALKVLAANGGGSYSFIVSGLDWCVRNDIQVANLSLGSSGDPGITVKQAFDNAYAAGLVIVSSAGNAGQGADTVGFPAKYDSVIAVGSTTVTDQLSSFSSTGPAVELVAPGSAIYSTVPGGGYSTFNGTSMAAPHVTGVAALIIAAGIADLNGNQKINDEVRWVMQATAEDLGAQGRDNLFGFGLVDAASALWLAANPNGGSPPIEPSFNPPSNLTGTSQGSLVTLTWQDNSNVEGGFELQYGLRSKNRTSWDTSLLLEPDTTSWALTLASGTYRFRVRAVNGQETTAWSNEIERKVEDGSGGGGKGGGSKR